MATGEAKPGSSTKQEISEEKVEDLIEAFGNCKWFNSKQGYGFITPDTSSQEKTDVFVHQSSIDMEGFRSLQEGDRVKFWYKPSKKGLEAVKVVGPGGEKLVGAERTKKSRPSDRRSRCYNCDEEGHHAKQCLLPPWPKKCFNCKSFDHLIADCPNKHDTSSTEESNGSSSHTPCKEEETSTEGVERKETSPQTP
uniref:Zinc finger protein ZF(CCHC)-17 n=1 Tax=Ciona intestinalis TaxID=7719 RepID=A0A1W3JL17_CIOIN|nr:zinc finger protein ZF(CCHC)-17 isoform X1 [Ciona intestinalis]XP_026692694.1 zinc finger protein ZF(CCHC)-17 isoform X1 [Ciona intestinalis]|eukprot:XP_009860366.1 zinc finger protein ZF(CCHC)-17 isoform X1 [Ciona intestinalis]